MDMSADEAVALGIKAIRHATFRDAYSGGFINVFLITGADGTGLYGGFGIGDGRRQTKQRRE
jgi:20S proteasome alpha/beta subunit